MTPTPTQIAEWRVLSEFSYLKSRMPTHELRPSNFFADGYVAARTEQATEIEALKAKLASAAEGLAEAYSFQSSGTSPSIHDYGRWRRIEVTITQLLKD